MQQSRGVVPRLVYFRRGLCSYQTLQCNLIVHHQSGSLQSCQFFLAELSEKAGNGFARCADDLGDFFMSQAHLGTDTFLGVFAVLRELKQKSSEFFTSGMREPQGPDQVIGTVAVVTEMLRRLQASTAVFLE